MTDKLAYASATLGGVVLVRNLWLIFMVMPDEASQGMVYRLLYLHVPAWWTAFAAVILSAVFSAYSSSPEGCVSMRSPFP
jgi:heme exporter protein C